MSDTPFKPNCRYGHGDLIKLDGRQGKQRWGLVAHDNADLMFVGSLYACNQCGYLEMFDDDIKATLYQQNQGKV